MSEAEGGAGDYYCTTPHLGSALLHFLGSGLEPGNGHLDAITQNVWRYMGDILQFWLTQTGYPQNQAGAALDLNTGIDGLRGDFGQGMPPRCWEYIINRTQASQVLVTVAIGAA